MIYERALRQNRVNDVVADVNCSLENCSTKLEKLNDEIEKIDFDDMKQIEFSMTKLRLLLNDIDLISYDIEQIEAISDEQQTANEKIEQRWANLRSQAAEKYRTLEEIKSKRLFTDQIEQRLKNIEESLSQSTLATKFSILIDRLKQIEEDFDILKQDEFAQDFLDLRERVFKRQEEFNVFNQSVQIYQRSLKCFIESLNESERYLNSRKAIGRRFTFNQTLLKELDEHRTFENQIQLCKEQFINLNNLASEFIELLPKVDAAPIRSSLISVQSRWQRVLTRANERTEALNKWHEERKKVRVFYR